MNESKIPDSVDQDDSGRIMCQATDVTSVECLRQQSRHPQMHPASLMSSFDTSSWPIQVSGLSSTGAQIESQPPSDLLFVHSASLRYQQQGEEQLSPDSTISDYRRYSLEL